MLHEGRSGLTAVGREGRSSIAWLVRQRQPADEGRLVVRLAFPFPASPPRRFLVFVECWHFLWHRSTAESPRPLAQLALNGFRSASARGCPGPESRGTSSGVSAGSRDGANGDAVCSLAFRDRSLGVETGKGAVRRLSACRSRLVLF